MHWLRPPSRKQLKNLREEEWAALESFFDSPQLSVNFNVQDGGKTLVLSFALQSTPALQATSSSVSPRDCPATKIEKPAQRITYKC